MVLLLRFFLLAFVIYLILRLLSRWMHSIRGKTSAHTNSSFSKKSPHEVLGVSPNASQEEIKEAYKKALAEYHPDKVMHLGEDLQALAKERSHEIIAAYEALER